MKDPRERHIVCKLDRCELEHRYLRLLEELNSLKKLSNSQEDKIKRLATKLMRFGANPRTCIASIQISDEADKLALLENENSKLKEKVCVLRNQLVNNRIFGRSPSRSRKIIMPSNSGPVTCRSEGSRLSQKAPSCQCINSNFKNEDNNVQNYVSKIQEMEAEKKEMLDQITELEAELAAYRSGNRREKVAENVEYIRVWRQMKQEREKFIAAQNENETLNKEIQELKSRLEQTNQQSKEMSAELEAEKNHAAELDNSMLKIKNSQIDLREKDEQILDLTNEMQILQQHNRELLELSTKFGKVEQENIELRRKIGEQLLEQQTLNDALNKEKTNMLALQASNNQLLTKLHESQKHIDIMTIQLMKQNEQQYEEPTKVTNKNANAFSEDIFDLYKEHLKENFQVCNKCCDNLKTKVDLNYKNSQNNEKLSYVNKTVQTENLLDNGKLRENSFAENKDKNNSKIQSPKNGNSLSRKDMLKLLEQVQINAPLESQNASKMKHSETLILPVRNSMPISNLEKLLFGDSTFQQRSLS